MAFTTLLVVRANVEPSALVNVVVALLIDAVVTNEPVLIGVTFKAKDAVTAFCACEALTAYDADVAILAVDALVAFIANELLVDTKAYEADVATLLYEALTAVVAVSALEAVISKLPVIVSPKPVCNSLPLICVKNWND